MVRCKTAMDVYMDPDAPDVATPIEVASLESALTCLDPSLTVQSQAEDADINNMIRRFGLEKVIEGSLALPPSTVDFDEVFDFQSAQNVLVAADRAFMAVSWDVRKRFNNNAAEFVDFCSERDRDGNLVNLAEMRKFGLAVPEKVVKIDPPMKVEVVNSKEDSNGSSSSKS